MAPTASPNRATQQATISAFFNASPAKAPSQLRAASSTRSGKRSASPIILDSDGDGDAAGPSAPAAKKAKMGGGTTSKFFASKPPATVQTSLRQEPGSPTLPTPSSSTAQQWRFVPSSEQDPASTHTEHEDAEKARRHEAFRKALLGPRDPFAHRASLADARSVEELRQLQADADASAIPDDELGEDEDDPEEIVEVMKPKKGKAKAKAAPAPEEDGESDPGFKSLMAGFASGTRKVKSKPKAAPKPKKAEAPLGPCGLPYTPLELQVLELKKAHPGTLLMVEVGYKYLFYEEDARTAAKELGFVAFPKRNLLTASMPVGRRDVHLKKFLSRGYKVGIVAQTETVALKQISEGKNKLFARGITALYTATTYVDPLGSVDEETTERHAGPALVCIVELADADGGSQPRSSQRDESVRVGWVAVSPSTGDVVWDEFEDGPMRTELETRLGHTLPGELLLPAGKLSGSSEKMLTHFAASSSQSDQVTRTERFQDQMDYAHAFEALSKFYATPTQGEGDNTTLATITAFPRAVVVALAHAIEYLSTFGVQHALLETRFFARFAERTCMLLGSNTLTNLEIYKNSDDGGLRGSLMWILDRTQTKFGARMLKTWVGRPLIDKRVLEERLNAVEEIRSTESGKIPMLRSILNKLPDLARGLARIQYGRCTPKELHTFLKAFNKVATTFSSFRTESPDEVGFRSPLLNSLIWALPRLRTAVQALIGEVNLVQLDLQNKSNIWTNVDRWPGIEDAATLKEVVEAELQDELKSIRKLLKKPALQYTTNLKDEYLIELKKADDKLVPNDWSIVSSTKYVRRYHSPSIKRMIQERAQHIETLEAQSDAAFIAFLAEIADVHYGALRDAIQKLATADCLLALAQLSLQPGYVKPEFSDEDIFQVIGGRHPMLEQLRSDPYVPNDMTMGGDEPRSKVITGPNMGGKSSCVRMLALCAIMAQIGAYVPADSCRLRLLDGIMTRMGAFDEIAKGRSTFMVEMTEASDILKTATDKSLVILDELGRGTSTFDGMAIADAVLQHLIDEVKCKTLFITHYPLVATEVEKKFPNDVQNLHMGFTEIQQINGTREITFLYQLTSGVASGSFGVECGRLAALPESLLENAARQAASMQSAVEERHRRFRLRKSLNMLGSCLRASDEDLAAQLQALRVSVEKITQHEDENITMDMDNTYV